MELSRAECLACLATASLGRVVFTVEALPAVQPVTYVLAADTETVILQAPRRALRATVGRVVGFQVDRLDNATGNGWNVLGVGWIREAVVSAHSEDLATLTPSSWLSAPDAQTLAIPLQFLAGRLLSLGTLAAAEPPR